MFVSYVCCFKVNCCEAHLKGACLEKGNLVMLRERAESRDVFGKLHHLSHGRCEAEGEVFPDFLSRLIRLCLRVHVHWTSLLEHKTQRNALVRILKLLVVTMYVSI